MRSPWYLLTFSKYSLVLMSILNLRASQDSRQRGSENVDVYHFHRDAWVLNNMGNMMNQPVFTEKISKKQHFMDFLDFQILHFQGNLTFLSQCGYYVVVFVL